MVNLSGYKLIVRKHKEDPYANNKQGACRNPITAKTPESTLLKSNTCKQSDIHTNSQKIRSLEKSNYRKSIHKG